MDNNYAQCDNDTLFQTAKTCMLQNNFDQAIDMYTELLNRGGRDNPGVVHNSALAAALNGDGITAMGLLDSNMQTHPRYTRSFLLAAELYRRVSIGDKSLIDTADSILKTAIQQDINHPQTCIVASEIAMTKGDTKEALKWHVRALGAAKARTSRLASNFAAVMLETFADESLHIFSQAPIKPVVTGSAATPHRKCLAVVVPNDHDSSIPVTLPDTVNVLVTYGDSPTQTGPSHLHVRTTCNWAAVFAATQYLLTTEWQQVIVWNKERCADFCLPDTNSTALIAVYDAPLSLFSLQPSSLQEVNILKALYDPQNVPPSETSLATAELAWKWLVEDCELDVDYLKTA